METNQVVELYKSVAIDKQLEKEIDEDEYDEKEFIRRLDEDDRRWGKNMNEQVQPQERR